MSFYDDFPFRFRDRTNQNNFVNDLRNEFENDRNMWGDNFGNFFGPRHSDLRSRMGQHRPDFHGSFPKTSAASAASAAAAASSSASSSCEFPGERVIPIHICTDDEGSSSSKNQSGGAAGAGGSASEGGVGANAGSNASTPTSQKTYAPQRNHTTEIPRMREISRNQRAQSAPPTGSGIHISQCGGGQSKKGNATATPGRPIPIQVEVLNPSGSSGPSAPGPQPGGAHHHHQQQQQHGKNSNAGSRHDSKSTEQPTPPKKPTLVLSPMEKIQAVAQQVRELAEKVKVFTKDCGEKEYIYLDEMLTRCLIQLDDVEVEGKEDLRQARKECIKSIQQCISDLELKAGKQQPVNTDVIAEEDPGVEPMVEDPPAATAAAQESLSSKAGDDSTPKVPSDPTAAEPPKKEAEDGGAGAEPMVVDQAPAAAAAAGDGGVQLAVAPQESNKKSTPVPESSPGEKTTSDVAAAGSGQGETAIDTVQAESQGAEKMET